MEHSYPTITLFGSLSIRGSEGAARTSLSGSTGDVFAYLLAYAGKDVRRERLADLFWTESEPARARAALNTAVWRINKVLAGLEGIALRSGGEHLMLETCPEARIDARRLEAAVRDAGAQAVDGGLDTLVRARLAEVVDDYNGPFLDGSASDWAIVERERLNTLHLRGLSLLMRDCAGRRDYEEALVYGRRILAADPFREQVQCEVMWLYVLNGQRPHALRQFETYRRQIAREMNVAPMAETRALADHIRDGREATVEFGELRSFGDLRAATERSRLDALRAFGTQA
jgi:two-component SAPR family response regulator